jgi:type II secretory pathway pseudopilin PulG
MKRHSGFTLIETLIAAVILFTVLSLSALALKTARSSSASAEKTIKLRAPLPLLLSHIRQALRTNATEQMNGDGVLAGVRYQWQADSIAFKAAPPSYDVELGSQIEHQPRYRLYDVQLKLEYGGKVETVSYREFAWGPAQ